jgi:hypothetical protein
MLNALCTQPWQTQASEETGENPQDHFKKSVFKSLHVISLTLEAWTCSVANLIANCSESLLTECLMRITTIQLRYEAYEQLRLRSAERPWIIPTKRQQYSRFSGPPIHDTDPSCDSTLSQGIETCDSPYVVISMSFGDFSTSPSRHSTTFDNLGSWAMRVDSLNPEASQIRVIHNDAFGSLDSRQTEIQSIQCNIHLQKNHAYVSISDFFTGMSLR